MSEDKTSFNEYLFKQRSITYDRLLAKADEMGCELLSSFEESIPRLAKIRFKCQAKGHVFSRRKDQTYGSLQGCHFCLNNYFKVDEANLPLILKDKGWEYVSGEFRDKESVITAKCRERGHLVTKKWLSFISSGCLHCQPINRIRGAGLFYESLRKSGCRLGPGVAEDPNLRDEDPVVLVCSFGHEFKSSRKAWRGGNRCPQCNLGKQSSSGESEIAAWLKSLGFDAEPRKIGRYNYDVVIESHKLALEYHGLYYHSERFKEHDYHLKKFQQATEHGYRLFQFWEDEWLGSPEVVKSMILVTLGHESVKKVDARDCKLGNVGYEEAMKFLTDNHLMGPGPFASGLGLYFEGDLVSLIVIAQHPRNSQLVTLSRLCTKMGMVVRGGASRLISKIPKEVMPVYTWSDNRFSEGKVYETLGFVKQEDLAPDYQYVKSGMRFGKQAKRKAEGEIGTEFDLREKEGYVRIFDAGKIRWVLK